MADRASGQQLSAAFDLVLKVIVTATLLCIAVITFIDVIGRYFFNAPVPGAFEIQEFGMGVLIFSGLPLVTRARSHITVSLFDAVFARNATVQALKSGLVHLISSGILFFVATCLSRQAMNVQKWGSTSVFLQLPIYPVIWLMVGMTALSATICLVFAAQALAGRAPQSDDSTKDSIL
jgi:TRAP-type transport system small permease protein